MFAGLLLLASLASSAASTPAVDTPAATDNALPRYGMQPGQEISFLSSSSFKFGEGENAGAHDQRSEWTVWVLRANPDGGFRLVFHERSTFAQTFGKNRDEQPPQTYVFYADVFPDGRVMPNSTIPFQSHPRVLFPLLPRDLAEAKAGWQARQEDSRIIAKPVEANGAYRFEVTTELPLDKIHLSSQTATFTFDPARNLIAHADTATTRGYGFKGAGKGTLELQSVKTIGPETLAQFEAADAWFAAASSYEAILKAVRGAAPEEAKVLLAKAYVGLKTASEEVKEGDFRTDLVERTKTHQRKAKYFLEDVEWRAKTLGTPTSDFETTDLDGKKIRLADLRGKVVILDFWFCGCGWCIKAMPQLNQLAAEFSDRPVIIFGMNTDGNVEDARLVVEKMGLTYSNLKAEGLPEKFGVRGAPTLIIIDQQGKIHDIHAGYSPTLGEEVGSVVRKLLASK